MLLRTGGTRCTYAAARQRAQARLDALRSFPLPPLDPGALLTALFPLLRVAGFTQARAGAGGDRQRRRRRLSRARALAAERAGAGSADGPATVRASAPVLPTPSLADQSSCGHA